MIEYYTVSDDRLLLLEWFLWLFFFLESSYRVKFYFILKIYFSFNKTNLKILMKMNALIKKFHWELFKRNLKLNGVSCVSLTKILFWWKISASIIWSFKIRVIHISLYKKFIFKKKWEEFFKFLNIDEI
jgi:hypothetical protein